MKTSFRAKTPSRTWMMMAVAELKDRSTMSAKGVAAGDKWKKIIFVIKVKSIASKIEELSL